MPQLASITRSSAPVSGWRVNITPAVSGITSCWTTTAICGSPSTPKCLRYIITASERPDSQTLLTASTTASALRTLSTVRCWPAKLVCSLSSPIPDERTETGHGEPARSARASCAAACLVAGSDRRDEVGRQREAGRHRQARAERRAELHRLAAEEPFVLGLGQVDGG